MLQTVVFPLNLAFALLVAFFLYGKGDFSYWYIAIAAILLGLFANLNIGLVLIALSLAFLIIHLFSKALPENNLSKISLVLVSLVVSEVSLTLLVGLTK